MLKDVGVRDVWKQISTEYRAIHGIALPPNLIKQKLDSYVNYRNEVAHNGVASNLARTDLLEAISFYDALAECIDRTLLAFVASL